MHYMSSTLDHNLTCVVPHTYSNVCVVHMICMPFVDAYHVPYSGKVSRDKTFANRSISRILRKKVSRF